jgi:hypothetical protein
MHEGEVGQPYFHVLLKLFIHGDTEFVAERIDDLYDPMFIADHWIQCDWCQHSGKVSEFLKEVM